MSLSSGIDQNNNDADYRGKFYPDLIPWNHPDAQQNLGQVLAVGNQALNPTTGLPQSATDFDTLGCISIETGKVYQGNNLQLEIGEVGDTLKLVGAITKGSILVGSGSETKELPVGADNLYLKASSSATYGVEWAVAGGGGGGVSSVSAGTNISVSGTATNPIVNVANPLTSVLNILDQNITGTTGSLLIQNANPPTNAQAQVSAGFVSVLDTGSPSINSVLQKTGFTTQNATDLMTIAPASIQKTGSVELGITSVGSSIGLTPLAGADLNMNISGAGRVHIIQGGTGGDTQPAISVENNNGNANGVHLDLYKNSASPAVADAIGGVSFHGNSSTGIKTEYASLEATILDPTNASQNGSLVMSCCINSATPSAFFTCNGSSGQNQLNKPLDVNSQLISTTAGAVQIANTLANQNLNLVSTGTNGNINITKTGTGGAIQLSSSTQTQIIANTLLLLNSGSGDVRITQPNFAGSTTKLTTDIANKNFYPESVITNSNTNSASVNPSTIQGERLVLENRGVSPLITWIDNGSSFGSGITASFFDATNNLLWVAFGNTLQVLSPDYSTVFATNTLTGTSSGSNYTPIKCLYAYSQWIYVGGDFTTVNGNAQSQFGITRFFRTTWNEDPIFDTASGCSGVNGYVNCLAGDPYNPNDSIFAGGFFSSVNGFSPTTVANLIRIDGVSATGGGMNVYTNWCNELSCNAEVRCAIEYNGKNFFGGDFTLTSILTGSPISINFFGSYYTSASWTICDGNSFNGLVVSCSNSISGNVLVGGAFNQTSPAYLCYIDASSPSNPYIPVNISPSSFNSLNSVSNTGSGWDSVIDSGGNVWIQNSTNNWVSKGQAYGSGSDGAVQFWTYDNNVRAIFSNYSYHRIPTTNPQNCVFTLTSGNFKFNGTLYTSYTITIPDQAGYFIGDGNGIWRPLGYNLYSTYS